MARVTVGGLFALALLLAAAAVSIAVAPIWRRYRDAGSPLASAARVRQLALRSWRHRRAALWGPAGAGVLGGLLGLPAGPVAAAVLAAYGAAGFVLVRGLALRRSEQRAFRLAADAVVTLAADLRAGQALASAWRAAEESLRQAESLVLPRWRAADRPPTAAVPVVVARVVAATELAERSGAPLADVLERLEGHLRAVERARAAASGQAAGARVSAGLLGAMPVAGVGLGVVIGVDASQVLLHTPLGALAVALAVALQLGGLAWAARLATTEVTP
jgi:tight adherence protein B